MGLKMERTVDDKVVVERFFGLAGSEVASYCGDREKFLKYVTDMEIRSVWKMEILEMS